MTSFSFILPILPRANTIPNKKKFFGMKCAYEKPYENVRKDFACRLKKGWYNVDIREKKKERRIRR